MSKKQKPSELGKKEINELANYRAFELTNPMFAGRLLRECSRGGDPPDILCFDSTGKKVGIELVQWVNERQMAASKARYQLEEGYRRVIRSCDEPQPKHVERIWLSVKDGVRLDADNSDVFREELYRYIDKAGCAFLSHPDWKHPQGHEFKDLSAYPALARYLEALTFFFRERAGGFVTSVGAEWITFQCFVSEFTPEWMRDALLENVGRKIVKYTAPHNTAKLQWQELDEFYLIAYYDEALLHNTPYCTPHYGLHDVTRALRRQLARLSHPFSKVFLFSPVETVSKVVQVWPDR